MNTLDLLKKDMQKHKVSINLPDEREAQKLYLILINAKTNIIEDLRIAYGKEFEPYEKIAKKIFGDQETEYEYGVFVNDDMKFVFAFNLKFASYDQTSKSIAYRKLDEFITELITPNKEELGKKKDMFQELLNETSEGIFPIRKHCTGGRISYAIIGEE